MYKTYFPVIDAILDNLRGNGGTETLNAQYLHLTDVQRAENTLFALGKKIGLDIEDTPGLLEVIQLLASESERQGFINGFRMASLLRQDCAGSVPAEAGFLGGYDFPHDHEKDAGVFELFLDVEPVSKSDTQMCYAIVAETALSGAAAERK